MEKELEEMYDEDKWNDCKGHFRKTVRDNFGERKLDIMVYCDTIRIEVDSDSKYLKCVMLSYDELMDILECVKR
jgi:hypothetical protein